MSAHTALLRVQPCAALPCAQVRLADMADSGLLGVGVPSHLGGQGGQLEDLFRDPGARHWLEGLHTVDRRVFLSQRLVIEALVRTDNIGLRELHLPDLLGGATAGASALESPPLEARTLGLGWQFHGLLHGVPNLQWLGDQPLWSSLVQTHQRLRAGLHHLPHP